LTLYDLEIRSMGIDEVVSELTSVMDAALLEQQLNFDRLLSLGAHFARSSDLSLENHVASWLERHVSPPAVDVAAGVLTGMFAVPRKADCNVTPKVIQRFIDVWQQVQLPAWIEYALVVALCAGARRLDVGERRVTAASILNALGDENRSETSVLELISDLSPEIDTRMG
jgi:hypothetical protein